MKTKRKAVTTLPKGDKWTYESKWDAYTAGDDKGVGRLKMTSCIRSIHSSK